MKKIAMFILMSLMTSLSVKAQIPDGAAYFLPKTELRFKLLIEKTTYTPGEFAIYSERFLRKPAAQDPSVDYRIVGIEMYTTAVPDSAKEFFLPIDKKHSIFNVELDHNGVLLAINAKGKSTKKPEAFKPALKGNIVNPHDFMSAEILAAGSTAKMAELTAHEIYDIRDSRNELSRGEADYMPKDGEQLRIMLANLDRQEQILLQTFQGISEKDTIQHEVVCCPEKEGEHLVFRFSKKLGMLDIDDLGGTPYYVDVVDFGIIPEIQTEIATEKRAKDDMGITLNMPGKIKATLCEGSIALKSFECYAAQFGRLESLSSNMFGKKFTTRLVLNPVTGNVESMEIEPLD